MAFQSYTVSRNIPAQDVNGLEVKVALASVIHENGEVQTVVIPEDKIAFYGEDIIEHDVFAAAGNPNDTSLEFDATKLKPEFRLN